jgi:hypothetical protein
MVPLGGELDERQLDKATDAVAEYLYLDVATPASVFFDMHRAAENDSSRSPADPAYLRTFGVTQIGCSGSGLPAAATERVCRRVVARWQGKKPGGRSKTGQTVEQLADSLPLNLDALVAEANRIVQSELGEEPETFFQREVARYAGAKTPNWSLLRHGLDAMLGQRGADTPGEVGPSPLQTALDQAGGEVRRHDGPGRSYGSAACVIPRLPRYWHTSGRRCPGASRWGCLSTHPRRPRAKP